MLPLILYAKTYIINDQWVTVVKIAWKSEGRGSVVTQWLVLYFRMSWITHHFCDTPVLTLDSKSDYTSYRHHMLITASTNYTYFQKNIKERNLALLSSFKRITEPLRRTPEGFLLHCIGEILSSDHTQSFHVKWMTLQ